MLPKRNHAYSTLIEADHASPYVWRPNLDGGMTSGLRHCVSSQSPLKVICLAAADDKAKTGEGARVRNAVPDEFPTEL